MRARIVIQRLNTITNTGSFDVFKLPRITILDGLKIAIEANVRKTKILDGW